MAIVQMADGSEYKVNTLLSKGDSNTKLRKSNKSGKGYTTIGLSLSPAKESGYEVCPSRSPGCTQGCIFTSGRGQANIVKQARIAKTRLFFQDRPTFQDMLVKELTMWERRAAKKDSLLACRLNVFSDILWEKVWPELFDMFPNIQFYDYTKHLQRALTYSYSRMSGDNSFPRNYYLTFSRSEINSNGIEQLFDLDSPMNIAVVFDSKALPDYWERRKVINGDETDLRFLDPSGTIVGLYAKGKGKKDDSNFIVKLEFINRKG